MATSEMRIDRLPDNILLDILSHLSVKDRCISGGVCRRWRRIVQDKSLWREVNLLPYKVELRKLWKLVRAHLSDRLRILRVRGLLDFKSRQPKPPLSESMLEELKERCPSLSWLHMEPGNVTNLPSATLLPSSLTHLSLCKCTWQPRWLKDCASHFPHLVYLDLSGSVRVDNHDMNDLAQFHTLHTLKLDECYRLGDQGLQEIATSLTALTFLSLRGCNVSDLVVHHLCRHLTSLQVLDLSDSKVLTDSSVPLLVASLPKLEELMLDGCVKLTGKVFSALCKSTSLRQLSLVETHIEISAEDGPHWRELKTKCEVEFE